MTKPKVLVVDDEQTLARTLRFNLEDTGRFEVQTAHSGGEGIRIAKSFRPDFILLDVMMPDLDGPEVASRLVETPGLEDVPIVFHTAAVSREEVKEAKGVVGGRTFLWKPAKISDIVECIDEALAARR